MLNTTRLVQFGSGKWAIRRGLIFHAYADLRTPGFWWQYGSPYWPDCLADSKEDAIKKYDAGKVVHVERLEREQD